MISTNEQLAEYMENVFIAGCRHKLSFSKYDKELRKLAEVLHDEYKGKRGSNIVFIMVRLHDLICETGEKLDVDSIRQSIANYFVQDNADKKDVYDFIIRYRDMDGSVEFDSPLLTYMQL